MSRALLIVEVTRRHDRLPARVAVGDGPDGMGREGTVAVTVTSGVGRPADVAVASAVVTVGRAGRAVDWRSPPVAQPARVRIESAVMSERKGRTIAIPFPGM